MRFFGGDQMAEHSGANTNLATNGTSTWQEDGYWYQLWLHDVHYRLCRDHHCELQLDGGWGSYGVADPRSLVLEGDINEIIEFLAVFGSRPKEVI